MTNGLLAPNFVTGPSGLHAYAPWSVAYLDGLFFLVNGVDTNKRWNGATWALMGSVAPADFSLTLSSAGTPAAIPTGKTANYYVVGYDPVAVKETAPQGGAYLSITNSSGSTRDVTIAWTPGSLAPEFTFRRIYRALDGTSDLKLAGTVADATGTFLDVKTDAQLATELAYVPTYRTTLPPIGEGIAVVRKQMWLWQRNTSKALYAQPVNIGSLFVGDDFKADQFVTVGPGDSRGDIVHVRELYSSARWYKQRARYEMTGEDISNWDFRLLNGDRGLIAQRCSLEINGRFLNLDERGVYWDDPAADPMNFGARNGCPSPMQPIWDRLNLNAKRWFFALLDPVAQVAYFFVALDYEPIPNIAVVCDVDPLSERFIGIDTLEWGTAGGTLYDSAGRAHLVFGCDLGFLLEMGYGNSQGVSAGTLLRTVSASTASAVVCSLAFFDTGDLTGPAGMPMHRRDATTLAVVDANRVYSNTASQLVTYYYPTAFGGSGEMASVGVIAALALFPKFILTKNGESFDVKETEWHVDVSTGGIFAVWVGVNEEALAVKNTISSAKNHDYVKGDGGCWTYTIQITQTDAAINFGVRSLAIHYREFPTRRLP